MPRKRLFDEPSKSISVRVPESRAEVYRVAIKDFVFTIYKREQEGDTRNNKETKNRF